MTVFPSASTEAMRMFSVAVTEASSRSILAPCSSPRKERAFFPAEATAPRARKPAK